MTPNLKELAAEIHAENVAVGWWDEWPEKIDRHGTAMMLVVSELAEAMEGDRKNLMDSHLPGFQSFDVELADAMIRLLDLAGAYEMLLVDVDVLVDRGLSFNHSFSIPEQLWRIVKSLNAPFGYPSKVEVKQGIVSVIVCAHLNNVDLWGLVNLKRAYNKERADHKRENRKKPGGKSY